MKRKIKHAAAVLAACLALAPSAAFAAGENAQATKEEVVYVSLKGNGSFNKAYVVNAFDMERAGRVVDYGPYTAVSNLSTEGQITLDNGKVEFDAPKGRFYYQGNLDSAELPWRITVEYLLDGKPVSAGELAGASGALEIRIRIRDNEKAKAAFAEHYALQTAVTLDTDLCDDIRAEGATIASAGKNKAVSFIKLPGREAGYSVFADVRDFEMPGIQISGVLLSMDMEFPDPAGLTGGLNDLQSGIADLDSGAQDLKSGAGSISAGVRELSEGLAQMKKGMEGLETGFGRLADKGPALADGSQRILDALNEINTQLSGFSVTTDGLEDLANGSTEIAEGIGSLADGLNQLSDSFDLADAGISAQTGGASTSLHQANQETIEDLQAQIAALTAADPAGNASQIQQLTQIIGLLTANDQLISGLKTGIDGNGTPENPGLAAGAAALNAQYGDFNDAIQSLAPQLAGLASGMADLQSGLAKLTSKYGGFHAGLLDYTDGASGIYAGYRQLCAGFSDIVAGSAELSDGADAFYGGMARYANGTAELRRRTSNMDVEMQKEIDALLESYLPEDFNPVSFVSDRNTNVDSVQFVMMTAGIEKAEAPETPTQAAEEPGFWERLLALFGL